MQQKSFCLSGGSQSFLVQVIFFLKFLDYMYFDHVHKSACIAIWGMYPVQSVSVLFTSKIAEVNIFDGTDERTSHMYNGLE